MKKKFKKIKIDKVGINRNIDIPIQLKSSEISTFRATLLEEQNGICPICSRPIKDACLDHSHIKRIKGTGLIRGVLCRTCNVFIAKSENNSSRYGISQNDLPRILRSMAEYLERPHLPYIHPSEKPKEPKLTKTSYNKLRKKMDLDFFEKRKCPEFPKSGKLTIKLSKLFDFYGIKPEFYK